MINPKNDLFLSLARAAQKHPKPKALPIVAPHLFKPSEFVAPDTFHTIYEETHPHLQELPAPRVVAPPRSMKIEEKITHIIENPELKKLRAELEHAELLFKQLRQAHAGHEAIGRIEKKMRELRALVDQKTYV